MQFTTAWKALLLASTFAISLPAAASDLYFNANLIGGTVEPDVSDEDFSLEGLSIGGGFYFAENFFVQGDYNHVLLESDIDAYLVKGLAGYTARANRETTWYVGIGPFIWDSSDLDEDNNGYAFGTGVLWGESNLQVHASFDYLGSFDDDSILDSAALFSVGIRYLLGSNHSHHKIGAGRFGPGSDSGTSHKATTACDKQHSHLFMMCDK